MLRLALKLLYGDRAKYAMLVGGLTFCALLMTQQISVFFGLMRWTTATLRNIPAAVWVADVKVEQVNEVVAMREIEVDRVKSLPSVAWAVPLYWGIINARLPDGSFQSVQLTGLDTATLVGRPGKMLAGRIEDLRLPNAVIVDQVGVKKFLAKGIQLKIGSVFEINDKEARVVGLCESAQSFLGQPYVFTTYDRALEYVPFQRKRLSFILVEPKPGVSAQAVVDEVRAIPGLTAYVSDDFIRRTMDWYIKNTGIPFSFGSVVFLGIVVGIAIAGQTFYLFIHENLRFMAALKAMGAKTRTLASMVFLQALVVGLVGYGLGVGAAALFGFGVLKAGQPPFYLPWEVLVFTGVVILFICGLSATVGLLKIIRTEPATVFK
ncbi:MAG: ABC transporter permease [Verrucomicrobiota bacterium]|jgi:putative ABC transport system permease protein